MECLTVQSWQILLWLICLDVLPFARKLMGYALMIIGTMALCSACENKAIILIITIIISTVHDFYYTWSRHQRSQYCALVYIYAHGLLVNQVTRCNLDTGERLCTVGVTVVVMLAFVSLYIPHVTMQGYWQVQRLVALKPFIGIYRASGASDWDTSKNPLEIKNLLSDLILSFANVASLFI